MPPLSFRRWILVLAALSAALLLAIGAGASLGSSGYTLLDLVREGGSAPGDAATAGVAPDAASAEGDLASAMILRVRLPRVLLAVLAGAALAATGAVFQGLLRNPLADPYILGISGGAALGFIVASALGLGAAVVLPWRGAAAFVGALLTVGLLVLLSRTSGRGGTDPMILNGVVLNTIYLALILVVQTVIGASRLHGVMLWMVGNVPIEGYAMIARLAVLVAAGIAVLAGLGRDLNLIAAGEDVARGLGVAVERTRLAAIVCATLMTAAIVSVAGLIGFVGLIVPHAARLLFGPDHRLLIPASALLGGIFLVAADTAARLVLAPTELPVGVLTALCGGPFFLWLLGARRRKVAFGV